MILSAFSLEGKVAVVTGCDTGLGQGMALGLAQAGCDIVDINIVEPTETCLLYTSSAISTVRSTKVQPNAGGLVVVLMELSAESCPPRSGW